ncbi:MAG: histidine kinase [Prevotellaceae bacterium]|jgi:sensor histidine kinase YesM|nr:histidine kinase [Prevotellaceae bacterium]
MMVWIIVYSVPVINQLFEYMADNTDEFQWNEVLPVWLNILPFLLLFLLNNFVLVPLLFMRQKIAIYITVSILLSASVFWFIESAYPERGKINRHRIERGIRGNKYIERFNTRYFVFSHIPYGDKSISVSRLNGTFFSRILLALLMFSFNVAVKQFFRSLHDKARYENLERINLLNELRYLKYQINPHFFMNTLNNIHSLIDTDAEKAKQTLIELSRLMRYVLYDSNQRTVPVEKEVRFLTHYIKLMRLRYSEDKVDIDLDMPEQIDENAQIAPLIYISFLENAFKHGISYQHHSYVRCSLQIENQQIIFQCVNSCNVRTTPEGSGGRQGIGLDNIRKRLQLIYGSHYSLDIHQDNDDHSFTVLLIIPAK